MLRLEWGMGCHHPSLHCDGAKQLLGTNTRGHMRLTGCAGCGAQLVRGSSHSQQQSRCNCCEPSCIMLTDSAVFRCCIRPNFSCGSASAAGSARLLVKAVRCLGRLQVLRRNPSKHHNSKLLDLAICCVGVAWWAAAGIAFCIWTDRANKSGMMQPSWRNGLCALAWAQFLMFTGLTLTSLLLVTLKSQKWFDKYAEKQQHKKEEQKAAKQAAKLRKKQEKEAATVAAKPAAAPAPEPGALLPAQVPAAAQQGLPVSSAATHAAGAAPDAAGNPFITEGPDRV